MKKKAKEASNFFSLIVPSVQKYYNQMSFGPYSQNDRKFIPKQSELASSPHIKSDSASQMAKCIKQNLTRHESDDIDQLQEEFLGNIYKDLSSGVYQMSKKSEHQQQSQEQAQFYSQQISVGYDFSQVREKNEVKQSVAVIVQRQQRQREVEMHVASFMQKVLSPKLQSQEVLFLVLQGKIDYPSMMGQGCEENEWQLEYSAAEQMHQQRLVLNQPSVSKPQLYSQLMDLQVNYEQQNGLKRQQQKQELPQTEDLLKINQPKEKAISTKAHRIQQQICDEYNLDQKSKAVTIDESDKLRILGYQKQYFLKMETQVFQIQYSSRGKGYSFNRKFTGFVLLDKLMRLKYPGYILYPFPANNFEFVDKIKLSVGTQLQKAILIEKRLLQLQRYLNFLLSHRQLGVSQAFKTFVAESNEQYSRHSAYLQKQIAKEQQKFVSSKIKQNYKSIKNLFFSGLSYFTSYVTNNQQSAYNAALLIDLRSKSQALKQAFDDINAELQKNKLVSNNLQIKAEKLLQIYENNIQMKPIESSIDSVLRLSGKMASSKTAYQIHKNWIEDQMLPKIQFFVRIFAQVQEQIKYRSSLLQKIDLMAQEQAKLGSSLLERVQSFDSRFLNDWQKLKAKFEKEYLEMIDQFSKQWQFHCVQMAKVWK